MPSGPRKKCFLRVMMWVYPLVFGRNQDRREKKRVEALGWGGDIKEGIF